MTKAGKIGVLVVDDSAIVRKILTETIAAEADIEVVGTAPDPVIALEKINRLQPDVLTLDIEMPRMNGLTFLESLMRIKPMPVILISSLAKSSSEIAMEALRLGAVDVLAKPSGPYSVGELREIICSRIRAAARAKLRTSAPDVSAGPGLLANASAHHADGITGRQTEHGGTIHHEAESGAAFHRNTVIAIGASTGGTEALSTVLSALPRHVPPILIVQHMPPVFSATFAERLNHICAFRVREAHDGDAVEPGLALVAPGAFHIALAQTDGHNTVRVKDGPMVQYARPSVDVLFASVALRAGRHAVGVILTGMGRDGAEGLLQMKQKGAHTIAQDEATSVVFGMPREAIRIGAANEILPLHRIAQGIIAAVQARAMTVPHPTA